MKLGVYIHYKGFQYLVIGVAKHSETREKFVVYVPLYEIPDNEGTQITIRPYEMFNEEVSPGVKRFTHIEDIPC